MMTASLARKPKALGGDSGRSAGGEVAPPFGDDAP
jgi:hypothetical protein